MLNDVASGDHQALASLYDHIARLVYANVRRALDDPIWADTVVEEAFVEVWQQADRFDPSHTPAVIWILDLAHQLAAEHNRSDEPQVAAVPATSPSREPHVSHVIGARR
ncbi:MAG: sigma factor [Nitriliruptor sp.]|uniref:sigma factor n=1 Tax=Nitriliruptor sp. TaxID=2448056 RepID=UPI0034A0A13D